MVDTATLLPPNASTFERAAEQASGIRWDVLDTQAVARAKDPWRCSETMLPFLAFEHSVDIWDDAWPVEKKRWVIAGALRDHRLKGTEAGARRYVEIAGGELVQAVTPPGGIFAGPNLDKDQFDAWVRRHPKVRITLAHGTIADPPADEGNFADVSFCDWSFATPNLGPALEGRRAHLVRGGLSQPLQLYSLTVTVGERQGVVEERVTVPGLAGEAVFAGHGYADISFVDAVDRAPAIHTYRLDRAYAHRESTLALDLAPVTFEPRDLRYRRESETAEDPFGIYADRSFADDHFATPDISGELLADVLYLYDPAVPSPDLVGISFAGVDRVSFPAHNARLLIDAKLQERPGESYADLAFADDGFALAPDESPLDFLTEAVAASQRLSDRIGITFATQRQRGLSDGIPLDGSYQFGGFIKNTI